MKLSISNLSWGKAPISEILPRIKEIGLQGVEIAPTAIFGELNGNELKKAEELRQMIEFNGLKVSGSQSLLYGHPEYQLFSKDTWPMMREHLEYVFELSSKLGAEIAVFGSPKNRLRNRIQRKEADEIAAEFFTSIIPSLNRNNIVLTLEPNATEYGADYLINYEEVIALSRIINSPYVLPQIDTGCLWMEGEDPSEAFKNLMPHHLHISNPNLGQVPGDSNFTDLFNLIEKSEYKGWIVIESLGNSDKNALEAAKWLRSEMEVRS